MKLIDKTCKVKDCPQPRGKYGTWCNFHFGFSSMSDKEHEEMERLTGRTNGGHDVSALYAKPKRKRPLSIVNESRDFISLET